jgi:homopolymeric O-antigen transport system ATP-binding protein
MSNIAIRVDGLSKRYKIGIATQRHDTLRDEITEGLLSIFRFNGNGSAPGAQRSDSPDTFWAVKDVSFEVKKGEVLGIIGPNGAGKSTLLKILSRITEPTAGRVEIHGRVGSLLEVGTGFHSELTGRENLYLNGAILGMKKLEIDRKFDEIVAFAEVEKFIDTPVKRYSSGMYVRLAFAVAAHLEPEILIIDEVLAVGDLGFQKKCLGKMENVAREGRTVLFVSHNIAAVQNLCTTSIWIDKGQVTQRGNVGSVLSAYVKSLETSTVPGEVNTRNMRRRMGTGEARITKARLLDSMGRNCTTFSMGETIVVEFDVEFYRNFPSVILDLEIKRLDMGMYVLHLLNDDCGFAVEQTSQGERRFRVEIPNCLLYPAFYEILLCVGIPGGTIHGDPLDFVEGILGFHMVQGNVSKRSVPLATHNQAVYYTPSIWTELPLGES